MCVWVLLLYFLLSTKHTKKPSSTKTKYVRLGNHICICRKYFLFKKKCFPELLISISTYISRNSWKREFRVCVCVFFSFIFRQFLALDVRMEICILRAFLNVVFHIIKYKRICNCIHQNVIFFASKRRSFFLRCFGTHMLFLSLFLDGFRVPHTTLLRYFNVVLSNILSLAPSTHIYSNRFSLSFPSYHFFLSCVRALRLKSSCSWWSGLCINEYTKEYFRRMAYRTQKRELNEKPSTEGGKYILFSRGLCFCCLKKKRVTFRACMSKQKHHFFTF